MTQDAQAEKMVQALLRYGLHRSKDLPQLSHLSYWEPNDASDMATSFVLMCAEQVSQRGVSGGAWVVRLSKLHTLSASTLSACMSCVLCTRNV